MSAGRCFPGCWGEPHGGPAGPGCLLPTSCRPPASLREIEDGGHLLRGFNASWEGPMSSDWPIWASEGPAPGPDLGHVWRATGVGLASSLLRLRRRAASPGPVLLRLVTHRCFPRRPLPGPPRPPAYSPAAWTSDVYSPAVLQAASPRSRRGQGWPFSGCAGEFTPCLSPRPGVAAVAGLLGS